MKHPYKKIIVFAFSLIVLAYAVQYFLILGLRLRTTDEFGVWNRMERGQINADILFTGSSRTLMHINCSAVEEVMPDEDCFNLGVDGSRFRPQLIHLRAYLKHNRAPKLIVQGLDIDALQMRGGIYNPKQYIAYLDDDSYRELVDIDRSFQKHRYLPLYSFASYGFPFWGRALKGYVEYFEKEDDDAREQGWWPRHESWSGDFDRFKEAHPDGYLESTDEPSKQYLKQIIELAKQNGIKVVLVYSPEYIGNQELTINRKEIMDAYRMIADEMQVPFWDYSSDPLSLDKNNFYNSQHLNAQGATEFSKILAEKLQKEFF